MEPAAAAQGASRCVDSAPHLAQGAGCGTAEARCAPSPSPRLPSGRSRPSSTGYGEGRGEGAFPQTQTCPKAQTRGEAPPPEICAKGANSDLSPLAGRGESRKCPLDNFSDPPTFARRPDSA